MVLTDERCIKILVRKPEGKRQLGRPMRRYEDKIRMDVRKIGCEGVDWMRTQTSGGSV
jgi:hypothetical protein